MAEVVNPNISDEQELVQRIQQGDKGAFNILFDRYHLAVYRYCHLMLGNASYAEDIYQDAFFTLYRLCREGKNIYSIRGYLFSIARSRCLDHIEAEKRSVALDRVAEPYYYPDESLTDTMEHFQKALAFLPEQYREAFLLFSVKEYSYEEIADILKVSKNVVRNRIFRAKQGLQKRLGPILGDKEK